jgi:glutaconyl-CoA/methylmalonyl-CoA decarboxylase subunit delta
MESLAIFLLSRISLESLVIAIAGYVIVFIALVLLFWFFSMVPRLISAGKSRKSVRQGKAPVPRGGETISGETTAAIAMALHLYLDEVHDPESGVLTIKRISKAYSPWSSKIYAVRNQFNRI